MTTPHDDQPRPPDEAPPPPTTGQAAIDAALAAVALGDDVHEHPDELARALEAVQRALNPPAPPPGVPGPRA